jgi:hypothetical protein
MKHGKLAQGFKSMLRLRAHPIIAARDYYYSFVIYEVELTEARGSTYFSRFWDCFAVPRIRRANYGATTVMIAQQMCGINSKYPVLLCQCSTLTIISYLFLQLNYFRKCRLHSNRGLVRVSWLWYDSGCVHHPNIVPYRYQRETDLVFDCESIQALCKGKY